MTPEASFTEDLNAGSLDLVELIMAVEVSGGGELYVAPLFCSAAKASISSPAVRGNLCIRAKEAGYRE